MQTEVHLSIRSHIWGPVSGMVVSMLGAILIIRPPLLFPSEPKPYPPIKIKLNRIWEFRSGDWIKDFLDFSLIHFHQNFKRKGSAMLYMNVQIHLLVHVPYISVNRGYQHAIEYFKKSMYSLYILKHACLQAHTYTHAYIHTHIYTHTHTSRHTCIHTHLQHAL